ncbi:MotA/TolQ/ExbB proton channel family protein, partial [bacterium]|nr:MotA/TolQ/ExbB proton channel family protein [bacterium]
MQFIKGSKASRGVLAWAPQILLFSIVFSVFAFQPLFSDSSTRVFAQDAAEPAAAEPAPAAAAKPAPKEESLLGWLTDSLGWTYILVFLSLSFILVALFIMNLLSARREYVCPQHLIDGFEAHLEEKQYQEAYELAKTDESFLGNVLSAGLAKLSSSYSASVAAMQEVGADENMKLDHRLSYLALIGTISPMIGLFGTVHGMI